MDIEKELKKQNNLFAYASLESLKLMGEFKGIFQKWSTDRKISSKDSHEMGISTEKTSKIKSVVDIHEQPSVTLDLSLNPYDSINAKDKKADKNVEESNVDSKSTPSDINLTNKDRVGKVSSTLLDSIVKGSLLGLLSESYVLCDNIFKLFVNLIREDNIPVREYLNANLAEDMNMIVIQSILFLENLSKSGRSSLLFKGKQDETSKGGLQFRLGVEKLKMEFEGQSTSEKKQHWYKRIKGFSIEPYGDLLAVGIQLMKMERKEDLLLEWGRKFSKVSINFQSKFIIPFLMDAQWRLFEKEKLNKLHLKAKVKMLNEKFLEWKHSRNKKKAWQEESKKAKPKEERVYENHLSILERADKRKKEQILKLKMELEEMKSGFDELRAKANPVFREMVESKQRMLRFIRKKQEGKDLIIRAIICRSTFFE